MINFPLKTFLAVLLLIPSLSFTKTSELICICEKFKYVSTQSADKYPNCNESVNLLVNSKNNTIEWNNSEYDFEDVGEGNYIEASHVFYLNNGDRIANIFFINRVTGELQHTFSRRTEKNQMEIFYKDYNCDLSKNVKKLF